MDHYLIPVNLVLYVIGLWVNVRRIKKGNPRNGLRMAAACICLYMGGIYLLAILGIIPDSDIRFFARWFQIPLAFYIIVEALRNG